MSYRIVLELYVLLSIINAFLFLGNEIYSDAFPGESLRSPFNAFPLGTTLQDPQDNLDLVNEGIFNSTNPTNSTGSPLDWVIDGLSDFTAQIQVILGYTRFFTAGYVIDLLTALGLPGQFFYIVTVPFAIYVFYMTFVMITNRLGN